MRDRSRFPALGSSAPVQPATSSAFEAGDAAESSRAPIARAWAESHFAVTCLAYDARQISKLPRPCADSFRGVGNPHRVGPIVSGERVLDHACGGGLDLLLAAQRFGAHGLGIGIERDEGLLQCARQSAESVFGQSRFRWLLGNSASLPVAKSSVDVVLSNGALGGASPEEMLREVVRVLRPGGRLHLAVRVEPQAAVEHTAREPAPHVFEPVAPLLRAAGFRRVQLVERFSLSADPRVVGESFLAHV